MPRWACLLCLLGAADAATNTWNGATAFWSTPSHWSLGRAPTSSDAVVVNAGEVWLDTSADVASLTLRGGSLRLATTECPTGWFAAEDLETCVRAFSGAKGWFEAEEACVEEAGSNNEPVRGHLALVGSETTNRAVSFACAAATQAVALRLEGQDGLAEASGEEYAPGAFPCWIGLSDGEDTPQGKPWEQSDALDLANAAGDDGSFGFVDSGAVNGDLLFRAWARREPRFESKSNCAAIKHRAHDPNSMPRARWRSADCASPLPYVCTRRGTTTPFDLRVSGTFAIGNAKVYGRGRVQTKTLTFSGGGGLKGGADVLVASNAAFTGTASSAPFEGAEDASITLGAGVFFDLGKALLTGGGARLKGAGSLSLAGAVIGWSVDVSGSIAGSSGTLNGGGDLSHAVLTCTTLELGAKSTTMRSRTTLQLRLTADAPIVREDVVYPKENSAVAGAAFLDSTGLPLTVPAGDEPLEGPNYFGAFDDVLNKGKAAYTLDAGGGLLLNEAVGVYKVTVTGSVTETTSCLPWHASAAEMQDALNALPSVSSYQRTTVYRRGNGAAKWSFGYGYEVTFDSLAGDAPLNFQVACLGAACGDCPDALVRRASTPTGACQHGVSKFAKAPSSALCVASLSASWQTVVTGAESSISSTVTIASGFHHVAGTFPTLVVDGPTARAHASASAFSATSVTVKSGTFAIGASGLRGDDACDLLYAGPDVDAWRWALSTEKWKSPGFTDATILTLNVAGGEIRLCAQSGDLRRFKTPASVLAVSGFAWTGGSLRGNARLDVSGPASVAIVGPEASCRDGFHLKLRSFADSWSGGNAAFADGAFVEVAVGATLVIDTSGATWRSTSLVDGIPATSSAGRQEDRRTGWYTNPSCGVLCGVLPQLINFGTVQVSAYADAILELEFFNKGTLTVDHGAFLTLGQGGSGSGVYELHGALINRGGLLDVESGQGLNDIATAGGVLGCTGGELRVPDVLEPRLEVHGGSVALRGRRVSLSRLLITNGTLAVKATAANITVSGDVSMKGGALDFPMRDSLARASFQHAHTSPKNRDRGTITVSGFFNVSNGAIRGNVDAHLRGNAFIVALEIERGATVVNHFALLRGPGHVVMDETGSLENRGTVEAPADTAAFFDPLAGAQDLRRSSPAAARLQHAWEENMLYNNRHVEVFGDDSTQPFAATGLQAGRIVSGT
ncbi:hypothetical protein M885DRAFT_519171 [Pelagophyceae sp. CCMP2097]|nr:hypothetical protein M885DRAFT_519171 [Pelagophyceae sp. CCMP2097]